MQVLAEEGYPIVEYPSTNARRMVPACAKFFDAVVDKKLRHDGDPLLARHLSNAVVKTDNLGVRIVKENRASSSHLSSGEGHAVRGAVERVDGARVPLNELAGHEKRV